MQRKVICGERERERERELVKIIVFFKNLLKKVMLI
jgi:hypothetical protein